MTPSSQGHFLICPSHECLDSRMADGKVVEQWVNDDQLSMMQQLGVVHAPGQMRS